MPTLNKLQKLFLAVVGALILAFQLHKFSEAGIDGFGWVIALVAALLILPALSLFPLKLPKPSSPPTIRKPELSESLKPNSRDQVLYREVQAKADEIADSIRVWMGLPVLDIPGIPSSEMLRSHWLQYCIPYSACLMFASQMRRDVNFNKSADFVVIYGQSIQRMVAVAKESAIGMGASKDFNESRAKEFAKRDFGDAEDALLSFMDSVVAKKPEPDMQLLQYLSRKIGVDESIQPRFHENLRAYTKRRMADFYML